MAQTVSPVTVASETIENDQEVINGRLVENVYGEVPSVAFNAMGTSPAVTSLRGGAGHFRMKVTAGTTSSEAIAANNIVLTCGKPVRQVFLCVTGTVTPCWHVSSISTVTVNIGTKVAPVAEAVYDFEIIVLF